MRGIKGGLRTGQTIIQCYLMQSAVAWHYHIEQKSKKETGNNEGLYPEIFNINYACLHMEWPEWLLAASYLRFCNRLGVFYTVQLLGCPLYAGMLAVQSVLCCL